eukprot:PhM_4_TR14344/c0_g1_i1/m.25047
MSEPLGYRVSYLPLPAHPLMPIPLYSMRLDIFPKSKEAGMGPEEEPPQLDAPPPPIKPRPNEGEAILLYYRNIQKWRRRIFKAWVLRGLLRLVAFSQEKNKMLFLRRFWDRLDPIVVRAARLERAREIALRHQLASASLIPVRGGYVHKIGGGNDSGPNSRSGSSQGQRASGGRKPSTQQQLDASGGGSGSNPHSRSSSAEPTSGDLQARRAGRRMR